MFPYAVCPNVCVVAALCVLASFTRPDYNETSWLHKLCYSSDPQKPPTWLGSDKWPRHNATQWRSVECAPLYSYLLIRTCLSMYTERQCFCRLSAERVVHRDLFIMAVSIAIQIRWTFVSQQSTSWVRYNVVMTWGCFLRYGPFVRGILI